MTTLSHDNRLWASTLASGIQVERFGTRFSRQAGSLSTRWAALVAADALKRLNARNRRDAFGADAVLPADDHRRDEFGRPIF